MATQARHGTLIITVRDQHGALLDASQNDLAETDGDEDGNLRVFSCLNVPGLDAAEVTALIVFTDGTAALATRQLDPAPPGDSTLRLTTAVLTDQVQPAAPVPMTANRGLMAHAPVPLRSPVEAWRSS